MKYIVFLGDGMADLPVGELGDLTPLEKAKKPNIDYLARKGVCGVVKTVPDGMTPGSDVANLAVMGYDPLEVYSGRAPLEALSIGVDMADTDVAIRCNFVTLSGEEDYRDKTMLDYSAGEISTEESRELIKAINDNLGDEIRKFYGGVSYRNCLIVKNGSVSKLTPPHDISGKAIGEYLPSDETLRSLTERSFNILSAHPINKKRVEEGKNPANSIWLWGAGSKPKLPDFKELYGLNAAVISAVDLLKGIAIAGGMKVIDVKGATGRLDTDWDGKAQACVQAIKDGYDYVYLHMEAADECGHQGDAQGKVKAIEFIDGVVEKVLYELQDAQDGLTVLITPDHPTPLPLRTHTSDSVPFVIYDTLNEKVSGAAKYTEKECAEYGVKLSSGMELMRLFLSGGKAADTGVIKSDELDKAAESAEQSDNFKNVELCEIVGDDAITNEDGGKSDVIETAENDGNDDVIENAENNNESVLNNVNNVIDINETDNDTVDFNSVNGGAEGEKSSETDNDIHGGGIDLEDNVEETTDASEGGASTSDDNTAESITVIAPEDGGSDFILTDASELPPVEIADGEEIADENSGETDAAQSITEKIRKKKKEKSVKEPKTKKSADKKVKKEKSPLTKEEKKKRIIIYSVAAVLLAVIIVCSIVIPIVIINKDKIFVGKAEDFQNVDDGKYYVLTDDISVEGDLVLPRPYSIDLAGHTLTVSGELKYESNADETQKIVLGTKKQKNGIAEGVIDVGGLNINTAGDLEVNAVINSDSMSINAKNVKFITGVKVNGELTLSGNEIVFEDNLIFGENGKATLNGVRVMRLMKEARADFVLNASKLLTTQETVIKSAVLDADSELRVYGSVLGDITGGRLVVMSKTSSAASVSGVSMLWLHDDSNVGNIDVTTIPKYAIEQIKELTAPPTLNVTNEDGKIMLSIKTVAHAERYVITIGDATFEVTAVEVNNEMPEIVKADVTNYVSSGIGNIRISVVAKGGADIDEDLIVPSSPTVLNYTHEIKLTTPTGAQIVNDNGAYILSFDAVNFANKYKIEINGKVIETTETTYDITAELTKPGSYSVYIQAVNTDNAAIKNSDKALTGIDVYKALDKPGLQQINNDDGTISINITAPLAKMIKISYTDADGNPVRRMMQFRDTVELGRLSVGTDVTVKLIGYGYYLDAENEITIA